MTIDLTKKVTTRSGLEVEIWTTEARNTLYPVRGEVLTRDGWDSASWTKKGKHVLCIEEDNSMDLINPPEEIEGWANIYPNRQLYGGLLHTSREEADRAAFDARIACIKIKYTKGEGLD